MFGGCRCARSVLSRWLMLSQYSARACLMLYTQNTVSFNSELFIVVRRSRLFRLLRFDRSSGTNCQTPLEETANMRGDGYFQLTQDEVKKREKNKSFLVECRSCSQHGEGILILLLSQEAYPLVSRSKKPLALVSRVKKKAPATHSFTNTLSNHRVDSASRRKFAALLETLLTIKCRLL